MAPIHVFRTKYLQNFNLNFKEVCPPPKWAFNKPGCAPVFRMRIAQCEDRERLLKFARSNFYSEEPLRIGSFPRIPEPADINFHMSAIPHGNCILAVKPDFNESIIGAVVAAPKVRWQLAHMADNYDQDRFKWGRILGIWARAEKEANPFERYLVTRVLHAYLLAVHKDYRGYGIGRRLMNELAVVGKENRFEAITIDATSEFAACVCKGLGMKLLNVLAYHDHKDAMGYTIFTPPRPHNAIKTYGLRLR